MNENNDSIKVSYAKNINPINFNSTISIPIDTNVNIKTILDISSYMFEQKIECGNGKATLSGKIGIKALYVDMDNITNSISGTQSFNETISDNSISNDCFININNASIVNNVLSKDGTLKINCEISVSPILYLNLALPNHLNSFNNLIVKKKTINTNSISNKIDTNFDFTSTFETKDNVSKILCHNAYFCPDEISSRDNFAIIEGKLFSCLIYESTDNDEVQVKELVDSFNVKTNVEIENLSQDSKLDLVFSLDRSNEVISTETEDGNSIITIRNKIKLCGVAISPVNIDIVDDAYSIENEIDLIQTSRDCFDEVQSFSLSNLNSGEIYLSDEDSGIDKIVGNVNIIPEITNSYIKDENLVVEGVITSFVLYIDENQNYQQKQTEMPFIFNTKIALKTLECFHSNVSVLDCRVKAKRGTIIEIEYNLHFSIAIYKKQTYQMIDNVSIGKPLDFSMYDYQVFLAKPNETQWDLCKRIRISLDEISNYNKNLPLIMEGGEKIIIKR